MKNIDKDLIARIVLSVIAFINLLANAFGFNPISVDENAVYTTVLFVAALVVWIWGFWKNNNFTQNAKDAQKYLNDLKQADKNE